MNSSSCYSMAMASSIKLVHICYWKWKSGSSLLHMPPELPVEGGGLSLTGISMSRKLPPVNCSTYKEIYVWGWYVYELVLHLPLCQDSNLANDLLYVYILFE